MDAAEYTMDASAAEAWMTEYSAPAEYTIDKYDCAAKFTIDQARS